MPGPGDEKYRVTATLVAVLDPDRAWRVTLANGHPLVARVLKRDRDALKELNLKTGDPVILEVSPCDLSQGRIGQHS